MHDRSRDPNGQRRALDARAGIPVGILCLLALGLTVGAFRGPGPPVAARINEARAAVKAGDPERAYRLFQGVLEDCPEDARAWMLTGRALAALDRPFDAAVYLRRAVALDSSSVRLRYELAKALVAVDLLPGAEDEIAAVLARRPDHADALYLRAAVRASRGEVELAVRDFRRAQECGPSHPDRFRVDPRFDPIRNDARFVDAAIETRTPGTFRDEALPGARAPTQ